MKKIGLSLFIILSVALVGLAVEAKTKTPGYQTASVYLKESKHSAKSKKAGKSVVAKNSKASKKKSSVVAKINKPSKQKRSVASVKSEKQKRSVASKASKKSAKKVKSKKKKKTF